MKKVLGLVAATAILAAASFASAASIVGSKHDLSSTGGTSVGVAGTHASQQICIYCHAPHNAAQNLPLWNRTAPTSSFTLYSGVGMSNVSFKTGFTADSTSLFCMSCHDGVTNVNAVWNAGVIVGTGIVGSRHTATAGLLRTGTISGVANLTTDLSKTHPVNFPVTLDTTGDLNLGSGASMGPGTAAGYAWGGRTYPLFKTTNGGGARDTANRSLECGSCHAVHDPAFTPFLRDTMTKSQLCLGCHNK